MRVVAGSCGGRRLVTPAGRDTRPTTDRVREASFNALGSLDVLDGASVLDLFAGSGALGIEALSRGAARCSFVDADRRAIAAVRANLMTCDLNDVAEVHQIDAHRYLAGDPGPFDLALLDPPYAFDGWETLLVGLPATTVVIESDREIGLPALWDVVRQKWYGTTLVTLAQRAPHEPSPTPTAPEQP